MTMTIEISDETVKAITEYYKCMGFGKPNPMIIGEFIDFYIYKNLI